jgi:hypothetical protein
MGCYVNPPGGSKEEWLRDNATKVNGIGIEAPVWNEIADDELPVCLVDNGPFTAAAVGFSEQEMNDFDDPDDDRPKMWFTVKVEKLFEVSDLKRWIKLN